MELENAAQQEREQKIGKRSLLLKQQMNLRVNIDAAMQAVKDTFGFRDVEYAYVEKIDFARAKVLLGEAQRKRKELDNLNKEIAVLNAALGDDGNE